MKIMLLALVLDATARPKADSPTIERTPACAALLQAVPAGQLAVMGEINTLALDSRITEADVACLRAAHAPAYVITMADQARTTAEMMDEMDMPDMPEMPDLDHTDPPAAPPTAAPVPAPRAAAPRAAAPRLPTIDSRHPTGKRAPNDAAVVIGLEDYAFIADVPYAKRDAEAFRTLLVYTRGVPAANIQLLTTGSNVHIRKAAERAAQDAGPDGTVWIYYAGHGAASPTTRERILLGDDVRADADGFESRSIAVSEVETLASAGGAKVLTVLDTCFAGVGRGGDELMAGTRFAVPAYAPRPTASGPAIAQWNAAGPNQLSGPLDDAQHGAFTYWAIGALRGWADGELSGQRDGTVTAEEADLYVQRMLRTVQKRDQTPVFLGPDPAAWVLSHGNETGPHIE